MNDMKLYCFLPLLESRTSAFHTCPDVVFLLHFCSPWFIVVFFKRLFFYGKVMDLPVVYAIPVGYTLALKRISSKTLVIYPLERKIKRENRRVKRGETTRRKTGLRVSSSSNSQMWKEKYERKIKIKVTVVERGGVVWTGRLYSKTYIHVYYTYREREGTQKKTTYPCRPHQVLLPCQPFSYPRRSSLIHRPFCMWVHTINAPVL